MIYGIKTDDNKTVATMESASEAKSRLKLLLEVRA